MPILRGGTSLKRGTFVIVELVGKGGFGEVYLAHQPRMARDVAIKVLLPHLAGDKGTVRRFRTEALAAGSLTHPNVLPVFDFDLDEETGIWFLAMQYVPGGRTLRAILRQQLPVQQATSITTALAGALDAAHGRGIVHRDVKPENILLDGDRPLLADFGIAHLAMAGLTSTGLPLGSPLYVSPEQVSGTQPVAKSDQYSLAVVAYEMLAGRPPFVGDIHHVLYQHVEALPPPITAFDPTVSEAVQAPVLRALSKRPEDRFPSCREFGEALLRAGRPEPHGSPDEVPTVVVPREKPRSQVGRRLLKLAGLGVFIGFGYLTAGRALDNLENPSARIGASEPTLSERAILSAVHDGQELTTVSDVGGLVTDAGAPREAISGPGLQATTLRPRWNVFHLSPQGTIRANVEDGTNSYPLGLRSSRSEHWDLAFVLDTNRDGVDDAVVLHYTGGAHCCFEYLFLGSTPEGITLYDQITLHDADISEIRDLDADGVPEILTRDMRLAYFADLPFAYSPVLPLVLCRSVAGPYYDCTRSFPQFLRESAMQFERWLREAMLRPSSEFVILERRSAALGLVASALRLDDLEVFRTVRTLCPDCDRWLLLHSGERAQRLDQVLPLRP